eukprot:468090_1
MITHLIALSTLLVAGFSDVHPHHHHHHYHTFDNEIINIHKHHDYASSFFDTPPPPQDQCKSVNASEPPQCPMTIGPPCPPCYSNFQPDYKTGDNFNFTDADKASMRKFIEYYT